jgi:hypothetical protein
MENKPERIAIVSGPQIPLMKLPGPCPMCKGTKQIIINRTGAYPNRAARRRAQRQGVQLKEVVDCPTCLGGRR